MIKSYKGKLSKIDTSEITDMHGLFSDCGDWEKDDFKKESIERFKEEIKDLQARLKMKKAIVEAYLII